MVKNMNRNIVIPFSLFTLMFLVAVSNMGKKELNRTNQDEAFRVSLQDGSEGQQSNDQDASLTSAIRLKFSQDSLVSAAKIHVDTSNRSVMLIGTVMNQDIVDRALSLGRSVNGVKSVHSLLIVRSRKL
jgi:osmotically-inducible protein OsmY